jgi:hydroxymethylglutaryl-CoA lyase
MDSGAHAMLLPLSASHAHSLANLRKTPDDVVAEIGRIRALRDAPAPLPAGGRPQHRLRLHAAGPRRPKTRCCACCRPCWTPAPTAWAWPTPWALPTRCRWRGCSSKARAVAGDRLACGHFHDTRGLGLANVYAAWQAGVRRFDACLGGIGGCPHAPGASGNVATEDLAYLFASMGVPTGLDFDALLALRGALAGWLPGEPLHGSIWRAGLPRTLKDRAA